MRLLEQSFIQLSAKLGKDPMLVQGAGGNTSYKQDGEMWIKASGKWLANAEQEDIFVLVNPEQIQHNVEEGSIEPLEGAIVGETTLRPSIETTLHALMPHKVVLHAHPVELLSLLILEDDQIQLTDLLQSVCWAWVPYARPGIELTQAVQKAVRERQVDILLLGSHGLVVGGEDCHSAFDLMKRVVDHCRAIPRMSSLQFDQEIEKLAEYFNMRLPRYEEIHSLALDDASYKYCNDKSGVLYPDQAVFLGSTMPCYDGIMSEQGIAIYLEKNNSTSFIILKGKGVLISKDAKVDVDEMLRCHAEVLMRIDPNEKLHYLTEDEISRLLDWEPEKYRRTLSK